MKLKRLSLAALALLATPFASWGQTAVVSGFLGAFDVLNDTGQDAHGFEIQLEGALPSDLYYTAFGGRYGGAQIVPYATGVYVRYQSPYSAATGTYAATTPKATPGAAAFSWQDCYQGGAGYANSGCEHLGQSLRATPASLVITGRWLVDDPANPGQLIGMNPPAAIPFYSWSVLPPTATAPVLVTKVVAPRPAAAQFGEAFWIKIFKTDLARPVTGDELTSTNPSVVPEDPTQVETAWSLLQSAPPHVTGNRNRSSKANQAALAIATGSVIRRYEMYKYTGTYDAVTHEATCVDVVCNTPGTTELGSAVSAQNTAANVVADSLSVTKSGSGASGATVNGGNISCGGTCAAYETNGAAFSLTANPGGGVFGGWTGACSGTQLSCTGTINGKMAVGASFLLQYSLSVGRSNSGSITATPAGNDRTLDCGSSCSAKFTDGTVVTLTATPPAGKQFVNWSGACAGTSPTCSLAITKSTSVQAVFGK